MAEGRDGGKGNLCLTMEHRFIVSSFRSLVDLLLRHCSVGAKGRHHVGKLVLVVVIDHLRDGASVRIEPGEIRRQGDYPVLRSNSVEHLLESSAHFVGGYTIVL